MKLQMFKLVLEKGEDAVRHKSGVQGKDVKSLPAMQETPVRFLGWEDPLEKE